MKVIWTIAQRELKVFFDSLLAYIIIILFLLFTGFFAWIFGNDVFVRGEASLFVFFQVSKWTLFIFIPILTMRLIAEERHSGSLEMILTKPITEWQFVAGKYLSVLVLVAITLALTIPYYITVASIGPIDHGATITGYLGLLVLSGAYISIGLFASSISQNQAVAVLIALFIGIFFHMLFGLIGNAISGTLGEVLHYLSATVHFESMARGVIDSRDILYFVGIALIGLIASEAALSKRNVH